MDGAGALDRGVLRLDKNVALVVDEADDAFPDLVEEVHGVGNGGAGELAGPDHVPVADEEHQLVAHDTVDVDRLLPAHDGVPGRGPRVPAGVLVVAGPGAVELGDGHGPAHVGLDELAAVKEEAEVGGAGGAEVVGRRAVRPRLNDREVGELGRRVEVRLQFLEVRQLVVVVVDVELLVGEVAVVGKRELVGVHVAVGELGGARQQEVLGVHPAVERVRVPRVGRVDAAVVLVQEVESVAVEVKRAVGVVPRAVDLRAAGQLRGGRRAHAVGAEHHVELPAVRDAVATAVRNGVGVGVVAGERILVRLRDAEDVRHVVGEVVLVVRRERLGVDELALRERHVVVRRVRIVAVPVVDLRVDNHQRLPWMLGGVDDQRGVFGRERHVGAEREARRVVVAEVVVVGGVERLDVAELGARAEAEGGLVVGILVLHVGHRVPVAVDVGHARHLHLGIGEDVAHRREQLVGVHALDVKVIDGLDRGRVVAVGRLERLLAVEDAVVVPVGVLQPDDARRRRGSFERLHGYCIKRRAGHDAGRVGVGEVAVVAPGVVRHPDRAATVILVLDKPGGEVVAPARPEAADDHFRIGRRDGGDRSRVHEVGGLVRRDHDLTGKVRSRVLHGDGDLGVKRRALVDEHRRLRRGHRAVVDFILGRRSVLVVAEDDLERRLAGRDGDLVLNKPVLVKDDPAVGRVSEQEALGAAP